jgi:hypothetical protein
LLIPSTIALIWFIPLLCLSFYLIIRNKKVILSNRLLYIIGALLLINLLLSPFDLRILALAIFRPHAPINIFLILALFGALLPVFPHTPKPQLLPIAIFLLAYLTLGQAFPSPLYYLLGDLALPVLYLIFIILALFSTIGTILFLQEQAGLKKARFRAGIWLLMVLIGGLSYYFSLSPLQAALYYSSLIALSFPLLLWKR